MSGIPELSHASHDPPTYTTPNPPRRHRATTQGDPDDSCRETSPISILNFLNLGILCEYKITDHVGYCDVMGDTHVYTEVTKYGVTSCGIII